MLSTLLPAGLYAIIDNSFKPWLLSYVNMVKKESEDDGIPMPA
jgi:hypothetical protein